MIVYADRPSARALNPALPTDVDMVFRRGLAKLPTDRYPSCADFVWALEEASKATAFPDPAMKTPAPAPVPAPAPPAIDRATPRASNLTGYLLPVGIVLLALIAAVLIYKVWPRNGPAPTGGDRQAKTDVVTPVSAPGAAPTVAPGAAPAAPVVTQFVADPPSIESGSAATLRWNVTGAPEVALDQGIGKVATADKLEVKPLQATDYVLTATGPGGKVTALVSVKVTPPAAAKKVTPPAVARAGKPDRAQMYSDALVLLKVNQNAKAIELLKKAADLGETRAMIELGEIQMEDNPGESAKWFHKAADAGDSAGMLNLGALYQLGNGVLEDYGQAANWYRKAADAGNVDAMYNLGRMYEIGQAVGVKDPVHAREFYNKAAALGNTEAKAGLERLNAQSKAKSKEERP
jgi:hypothetical protein